MNSRTLLFAAASLFAFVHPAFAQTDPHHPSGSADTASSEQPTPTVTPATEMPTVPAPADDPAATCPPMMLMMADMMKMMQQGSGDTPEMQMMQMMQATQMGMMQQMQEMQAVQMSMMQQMQEMQNDLMQNAPSGETP
jgi:hypothetical protein